MAQTALARAANILRTAKKVVVFTGAGMSAGSGLPTFRTGKRSLWGGKRLALFGSIPGYASNANDAWAWYSARRKMAQDAEPHAGYQAVNDLAGHLKRLTVVTQNIDGLHKRAGATEVLELHGNLREVRCLGCKRAYPWPAPSETVPLCSCGEILCPNVVLFGEDLPIDQWERAEQAASECDLLFSVGASHLVEPANGIPQLALSHLKPVIVVNTRMSDSLEGALFLRGRAEEVLPKLVRVAWDVTSNS